MSDLSLLELYMPCACTTHTVMEQFEWCFVIAFPLHILTVKEGIQEVFLFLNVELEQNQNSRGFLAMSPKSC